MGLRELPKITRLLPPAQPCSRLLPSTAAPSPSPRILRSCRRNQGPHRPHKQQEEPRTPQTPQTPQTAGAEALPPPSSLAQGLREQDWEGSRTGKCLGCLVSAGKPPIPRDQDMPGCWELLQLPRLSQALFLGGGKSHRSVAGLIGGSGQAQHGGMSSSRQQQGGAARREGRGHTEQSAGRKLTDTPDGGPGRLVRPERGRGCFQTKERHA